MENIIIKVALKLLISYINTKLFERVHREVLKAGHVKHTDSWEVGIPERKHWRCES